MTPKRKGWDWWSEAKLEILTQYLGAFTKAVTGRSAEVTCLDLFAGSYNNERRWTSGTFRGSAQIALQTRPEFTRLVFFELPDPASKLEEAIKADRPADTRWKVVSGDCNDTVEAALQWLEPVRWAPTFAFLDPRGLQVAWSTIETLAAWRADKKTKVEQWMLLPEPALARVLGLRGAKGQRSADRLDRLYGTHDWVAIHQLRRRGDITPEEMRAEFVNLMRWRLERELGYKTTHALQLVNTGGHPVYTMIFATDSDAGDRIMSHVYDATTTTTIPTMQARAQAVRQRREEESQGLLRFPELDLFESVEPVVSDRYDHVAPWEPPSMTDDLLDLEGEEDIDPDDVDAFAWADELEAAEDGPPSVG